jgi:hypothetical protein
MDTAERRDPQAPNELAWHLLQRTAELRQRWERAKIPAGDTFIGFDGSVQLFPHLPACHRSELPSFIGDEVFDVLVVDDSIESLEQLLSAQLPPPLLSFRAVQRALGRPEDAPAASTRVQEFLNSATFVRHQQMGCT